jgi:Flp pilus assembly secretin CpaC
VVVAQLRPGLTRKFALHLLKPSGQVRANGQGPSQPFAGVLESPRDYRALLGFLQVLWGQNLAKVMAEPRLVTLSGQQASFLHGGEQAMPLPAGLGQVGVQFEEFGTRLNFIPILMSNGKIRLEVEPEVSQLDPAHSVRMADTVVPGRTTNRVHAEVELKIGQTLLIGGLLQRELTVEDIPNSVPGWLSLVRPALGTSITTAEDVELLVLVTPWLISPVPGDQPAAANPARRRAQAKPKRPGPTDEEIRARLRRLERQLKRLQEEVDDLHRAPRSPHPN